MKTMKVGDRELGAMGGKVCVWADLILEVNAADWPTAAKLSVDVFAKLEQLLQENEGDLRGLHLCSYRTSPCITVKMEPLGSKGARRAGS